MVTAIRKRPLPGSVTGRVWSAADRLVERLGRLPTGAEVYGEVRKDDPAANRGTCQTQYSHWKKAYLSHFERGPRPKSLADGTLSVTIGPDGRLVIPASFREALGWKPGEQLDLHRDGDTLVIAARRDQFRRAQEVFAAFDKGQGSAADELIAERRREAARDGGEAR